MSFPYRPLGLATAFGLLTACATVPQPLQGTYSDVSTAGAQQGGEQDGPDHFVSFGRGRAQRNPRLSVVSAPRSDDSSATRIRIA